MNTCDCPVTAAHCSCGAQSGSRSARGRTLRGSTEVPTVLAVYLNMVQYWKQGYYLLMRKKMQVSETSRSKLLVPTSF